MDFSDISSIPIGLSYEKAAIKQKTDIVNSLTIPKLPALRREVRIVVSSNVIRMLDADNAKQVEEMKDKCSKCKRDCYISTLKRNAGICRLCTPKPQKLSPKPQVQKLSFKPILQNVKDGKQEVDNGTAAAAAATTTTAVAPATAAAAAIALDKDNNKISKSNRVECPGCKLKFTEQTLRKNGGTCCKCAKSKQQSAGTSPARKTSPKSPCPQCGTEYSPATLKKYHGLCRLCFNK